MKIRITRTYSDYFALDVEADSLEEAQRLEREGAFDEETWVATDGIPTDVVFENVETGEKLHAKI